MGPRCDGAPTRGSGARRIQGFPDGLRGRSRDGAMPARRAASGPAPLHSFGRHAPRAQAFSRNELPRDLDWNPHRASPKSALTSDLWPKKCSKLNQMPDNASRPPPPALRPQHSI